MAKALPVAHKRYYMYKVCEMINDRVKEIDMQFSLPSFDISYNGTGVFIGSFDLTTNKIKPTHVKTIKQISQTRDDIRARAIRDGVTECLGYEEYPFVVFEDVTVSRNFHGMVGVAMAKGIVLSCIEGDPFLIPVVNTQIKKMLTGDGRADKEDIDEALIDDGMGFYDDNQADAYGGFKLAAGCIWFARKICEDIEEKDDIGVMSKDILKRVKKAKKESPFTPKQMEVIVSVLSGPKLLKENDYRHYEKVRKTIKSYEEDN